MDELIFTETETGVLMARVVDGVVLDLFIEPHNGEAGGERAGMIYLGRVERVLDNLQAAFIDIGEARSGFLGAREARHLADAPSRDTAISDCVAPDDVVLVQCTRPASAEKGASLTANVTLPARMIVLTPYADSISISRAINDETEQKRLYNVVARQVARFEAAEAEAGAGADAGTDSDADSATAAPPCAGWVVRTAAAHQEAEHLTEDMARLRDEWLAVLDKAAQAAPPCLLYEDLTGVEKLLRDHVQSATTKIVIAGRALTARAEAYINRAMPSRMADVERAGDEDVLERYDIYGVIDEVYAPRMDLPSGGFIMIETTHALTAIDVNSGGDKQPVLAVNQEAARVIARQIRLRGQGGLIAIDFLNMESDDDKAALLQSLKAAFADDKMAVRFGEMSDFGVVEMTRKRVRQPLRDVLEREALGRGSLGRETLERGA